MSVRGLRFAYPGETEPVVDLPGLGMPSLDIARGEHTVVVGPSGCGKTTLLHLFAGILRPTAGTVSVAGDTVSDLSAAARRQKRLEQIGMVFQSFALIESLNALDNISLPERLRSGGMTRQVRTRAIELAHSLGLTERQLRRKPGELSQGERQRVAIGRALMTRPTLLMCDEPTGNLDPSRAGSILDLLFDSVAEHDATLIVVTHDYGVLDRFARVLRLGCGS